MILAADADIAATMCGLLTQRQASLGIRNLKFTIIRHPNRDPGCRLQAVSTAQGYAEDHNYALALFDKAGCGDEGTERRCIQEAVEGDLCRNGRKNRSKVIVIEPELETWVWSTSANVGKILGWNEGTEVLRDWLRQQHLWPDGEAKPPDPKSALKRAMMEKDRRRPTVATFRDLARRVSLRACEDPAFREMCETLQRWFPGPHARGAT